MRSPRLLTAAALLAALLATPSIAAAATPASYAPPPPYAPVPAPGTGALDGYEATATDPAGMPPGIVNGPCQPSPSHPYPVVLVHGTFANENYTWQTLAPMLSDSGYCVFGLDYGATPGGGSGVYATYYIQDSAAEIQQFVAGTVLPDTFEPGGNAAGYVAGSHPAQVDMVGHSQGGMMPRYLIDNTGNAQYPGLGEASEVHTLVGLAPSNHGTDLFGLTNLENQLAALFGEPGAVYQDSSFGGSCEACSEQMAGSPFLQALNAHPDPSSVQMYVIESDHDEVVTPYTSAFLPEDANAVNTLLQDQCPKDLTEHLGIVYDPVALADVAAALADNGPTAQPLPAPTCPPAVAPVVSG